MAPVPATDKHPSATASSPKRPQQSTQIAPAGLMSPLHKSQDKADKAMSDKMSDISKARSALTKKISVNTASNSTKLLSNDSEATFMEQPLNEPVTSDLYYIEGAPESLFCSVGDAMIGSSALYGWTTRDVLVKRARPPSLAPSDDVLRRPAFQLTDRSRDESLQVYNTETSMLTSRVAALQRDVRDEYQRNKVKQWLIDGRLHSQEAALQHWSASRKSTWRQLSHLDRKTGQRGEEKTLFKQSVKPPLPKLQRHWGPSFGPESDFPQKTQRQRFYNRDAFFLLPERLGGELDGITFSLQWSQRQLYKPPLSIVRPPILDETFLPAVSSLPANLLPEASSASVQWRDHANKIAREVSHDELPRQQSHSCLSPRDYPLRRRALRALALQGQKMELIDQSDDSDTDSVEDSVVYEKLTMSRSVTSVSSRGSRRRYSVVVAPCGPRPDSPYFVRNTVPAFKIDRYTYIWNQIAMRGIVEIGVVCDAGSSAWTTIRLANPGCCAMRYSWRHLPHTDHFTTGRYRTPTFTFNHKAGILLPEEKASLPVLFKSRYAGTWMERWMVQTTPHVGPGGQGEIPVALYGHALHTDLYLQARQDLENELYHSALVRMSERNVWDLIKFLPIRARQSLLKENIPPIPPQLGADDVQGFLDRNPGMHYHSTATIKLLAVQAYLHLAACPTILDDVRDRSDQSRERPGSGRQQQEPRGAASNLSHNSLPAVNVAGGKDRRSAASIVPRVSKSNKQESFQLLSEGEISQCLLEYAESCYTDVSIVPAKKSVDDFGTARAQLCVKELYQQAKNVMGPLARRQEELLRTVNEAILLMRLKPCAPPLRHYKRLLARAALVRLCDEIGLGEWRLRRSLGLLQVEAFCQRASFLSEVTERGEKGKGGKGRLSSKAAAVSANPAPIPTKSRKNTSSSQDGRGVRAPPLGAVQEKQEAPPGEAGGDETEVMTVKIPAPHLYRERLYALVYQLLENCLGDLLPVLTYDGYVLDPIARKKKKEAAE